MVLPVWLPIPLTVASVAKELKIAGISKESALIVSDKILMKNCFKANKLPIPWYSEIFKFEELTKIINDRGDPLIIKRLTVEVQEVFY